MWENWASLQHRSGLTLCWYFTPYWHHIMQFLLGPSPWENPGCAPGHESQVSSAVLLLCTTFGWGRRVMIVSYYGKQIQWVVRVMTNKMWALLTHSLVEETWDTSLHKCVKSWICYQSKSNKYFSELRFVVHVVNICYCFWCLSLVIYYTAASQRMCKIARRVLQNT